ncbi:MAG: hypothetical protein V2B19_19905 [Pseudomonadota bacterium]
MDLTEFENRCVQDEPPLCTARCPLHVDVRGFLDKAASGAWDEAYQILAATIPLPGIVARICDHPCERVCKRGEAGGPIAISEIERAVARRGRITKRRIPLPPKKQCVAVTGSGLSSLTAAWELAYKGYQVTIHETGDPSLLREVWGKPEARIDDHEKITLYIPQDVGRLMEERRILTEVVQRVIDHAEKSGIKFFNPDLGMWLASYKPAHVTYWVQYSSEGSGFKIHGAYSHRMEVAGNSG